MVLISAGISTNTGPGLPLRRAWKARRITAATCPGWTITSVCLHTD